ncbi:MAG: sigma-54 dependent transcriptional regulator [Deltaproteobacteria bacterium]|nr:sigma-54 dependent transcriptional regulator [Deltaproteobacteria bacterium]MDH3851926.1 sigma-54 dependent transcriptional regulator [Deltaproteobacteria bacterium]MDH3927883.1 sigma-54 dependent transcriptional regulator [Deltaproteobacteria bacterium]MDH3952551.1 sigma-54 dependent transcriptional regulator [Deltaproteobacteria bacterium]MDH3962327.1 sigma-54 dependent transcriptional regulator [Deltaproteobacteria bacterium]
MVAYSIYVVDDDSDMREVLSLALEPKFQVKAFSTAGSAIEVIKDDPPDLVLLDIGLPDMSGVDALREIKKLHPEALVIMVTASTDIDTAISTMKLGASDYMTKPINVDALEISVRNALDRIRLRKEVQALQEKYLKENIPCFVGESNAIQDVMQFVDKVAKAIDTPVLILGETGTGKELIASAIHYKSPNFNGPFLTLNCSAIPRDLIESELFGYEKGAFTGAQAAGKKGLVEQAADGTLFLDEVGDLSLEAQAKLLRFLEEGEYYRVGGTKKLRIQTRVVSATNKDLVAMIEKDLFRRDLYYRLAVIKVEVPSLNNRRDDIVPIARHFLSEFGSKHGKSFTGFSLETEGYLKNHQWQGNIRELRNLVERGILVGPGPELTPQDLGLEGGFEGVSPQSAEGDSGTPTLPDEGLDLQALEEHYLREALTKAGGNETKAAKLLRMSYYSFRYRRKKLKDLQA